MRVIGHGIDIVEIERFALLCKSQRYVDRCFTGLEQSQSKNMPDRLAARFAAKEAVLKALRLGLVNGVSLKNIEIGFRDDGSPSVALDGLPKTRATELGVTEWHLSFSHGSISAIASAIASGP